MSDAPPRRCVFLVDDDEASRNHLAELMHSAQLDVACFSTPRAFLEHYESRRPGCLVSEVRLPGMDGLELQQELERRHLALPVIFLTGHGDVQTAVQAMHGGAVDFIRKPADGQRILTAVRKALDRGRG